jgi:preprotein translocase subunit YajC
MYQILLAAANTAQQRPNTFVSMIPLLLIFVIFYFMIILPNKKRQKEHQKMIDNLKVHDVIITNGGIIGKIVNIKKDKNTVVIRIDETTNAKMEIQRIAIAGVINESKETKTASN